MPKCLRAFKIDHQIVLGGSLHWQLAFKNAISVFRRALESRKLWAAYSGPLANLALRLAALACPSALGHF
jgi:hypothetical protein